MEQSLSPLPVLNTWNSHSHHSPCLTLGIVTLTTPPTSHTVVGEVIHHTTPWCGRYYFTQHRRGEALLHTTPSWGGNTSHNTVVGRYYFTQHRRGEVIIHTTPSWGGNTSHNSVVGRYYFTQHRREEVILQTTPSWGGITSHNIVVEEVIGR